jgi:diketogulonate reductase-like aldo/keto reductase
VLSRGDDIVPIPGTKRRQYLEENAGAADVQLTPEELDRIESAFPKGPTSGDRYPDMSNGQPLRNSSSAPSVLDK